jgi:hypothetical protein
VVGFTLGMVWAATVAPSAYAEETVSSGDGRFALGIKTCRMVPTESVRRILTIEIGDLLLAEAEGVPADRDCLTIRCSGSFAWVQAIGPAGSAPVERIMSLDDVPGDAAPRALALAGLELLATLSSPVRARIASKHAPLLTSAVAEASEPDPAPAGSMRETIIGLAGTWRWFPADHGPSAWGGQVHALSTIGRLWQLAADAEVAGARTQVASMGETRALLLSCAASAGVHGGSGIFQTSLGLGGRFGFARLWGNSAVPATIASATVWHPWGGPVVTASALGRWGRFALGLRAEVGRSLSEANGLAGGVTAIAVRGSWVAISLGGDFHP